MKNFFLAMTTFLAIYSANAQSTTFKPFKVDFSLGYAVPAGEGNKAGVLFAIEPKYSINDNITVGIKYEGALMGRSYTDANGELQSLDVKAAGAYQFTGDYYFNTNRFRPFAGLGLGFLKVGSIQFDNGSGTGDISYDMTFAGTPRIGFEFGHFRLAMEYTMAGKTGLFSNNYLGIKLGFFAGGGRY